MLFISVRAGTPIFIRVLLLPMTNHRVSAKVPVIYYLLVWSGLLFLEPEQCFLVVLVLSLFVQFCVLNTPMCFASCHCPAVSKILAAIAAVKHSAKCGGVAVLSLCLCR